MVEGMNLNHLPVFAMVAQTRSFTRAAETLGLDKGHVSRVVRALETELGLVLVQRTSRSVTLTPAGRDLASQIASPLASLESVGARLVDRPVVPAGTVSLTTTPDLGRALVAPLLAGFRARYPAVRLRLSLVTAIVELDARKADIALRVGALRGGGLKARKLGELEAGLFAAPSYLAQRGTPRTTTDLAQHDGLWPQKAHRKSFAPRRAPPPPVVDCEDFGALHALCVSGGGVALLPTHLAAGDVRRGALVRVVPELTFGGAPLYVVTAPERPLPPRIAALRDFLVAHVPPALEGLAT